jgi:DNA-binding SARP family transcriptional activator/tetratricopeptide (TPR) repeat protein
MPGLGMRLLGGFEARLASGAVLSLPTRKAQALLAYLGTRPGQAQPRDKLAALLWGETRDRRARDSLRHALVALRKALADADSPVLRADGQMVALDPEGVEVDVATFERRVAEGTPQALEHAAELYQGDLLLGFALNEPLFEDWLVAERERLREMALEGLARLLAHQSRTGGTERAIRTAVRLLALDPLQEAVHRTLMQLYARQDRRGAALKQYQLCVDGLKRELGAEPERETKVLYQELLRRPAELPAAAEAQEDRRLRPVPASEGATLELPATETPLFGRGLDLERLQQALHAALREFGQVATVVGEAGIGKTRLVNALLASTDAQRCRVLVGRCHESDGILPFGPWVDALRRSRVSSDVEILGALLPRWRAELGRLLPETSTPGLPPLSDGALPLFESVAQLIEQVAARQPLIVVIDDLHWADEMSLRLLAFVSRRLSTWPVLVIATARSEGLVEAPMARRTLQDLSRPGDGMPIELSPLSRADTVRLIRALGRVGTVTRAAEQLEAQIWAMSEGNPFVTVEAMRTYGVEAGRDAASDKLGTLVLPRRVRELVVRHLERLSERGQDVVAVAAVIGRRFDFGLLQAASGMDGRAVAEAVEELVRHHVLEAVGNQLDFAHDRIREVAYDRLLTLRQGLLHRAVVEALEPGDGTTVAASEIPADSGLGDRLEQLAHHTLRGEMWDRAARYCWQAGAKAAGRVAYQAAAAFFEQGLAASEHLPDSAPTRRLTAELLFDLGVARQVLGEWPRALDCLRHAEALADALGDRERLGEIAIRVTSHFWSVAEHDRALEAGRRSLALAAAHDDSGQQSRSRGLLGRIHLVRGEYRDAIAMLSQGPGVPEGGPLNEEFRSQRNGLPAVQARTELALCLAEVGEFADAVARGEEACQIAEGIDRPSCRIVASIGLGGAWMRRGDLASAINVLERGFRLWEEVQIPIAFPWIASYFASAIGLAGRLAEARPLLERAVERASSMGRLVDQSQRVAWLAELTVLGGGHDDALRLGEQAVDLARTHQERGNEAKALRVLGKIHATRRATGGAKAEEYYRQALTIADELGMRPLAAHCQRGLGMLHAHAGKRKEATRHLEAAAVMYRDMGMGVCLEQAAAESEGLA